MVWIDRAAQLFQFIGLLGAIFSVYLYLKMRNPWVILAGMFCAAGFILPFYWMSIPVALKNWLVPYTKPGIVVSFFLNVAPWFYLLPMSVPVQKGRRKKRR